MIKESANYRLLLQGICVINCYAMIYNKGSSSSMGRRYAQSSLFYGVLVRTDIRSFTPIFCFFECLLYGEHITPSLLYRSVVLSFYRQKLLLVRLSVITGCGMVSFVASITFNSQAILRPSTCIVCTPSKSCAKNSSGVQP